MRLERRFVFSGAIWTAFWFWSSLGAGSAWSQAYIYNQAGMGTGNGPIGMTSGDFNRDGRLDLAVTNEMDNTVSVILSRVGGTYADKVSYAVGSAPTAVVSGDFNGDGIPDLAVTNSQDNSVSVLLGSGQGLFGSQVTFPTGKTPVGIVTADFTGDGKLDLAVLNGADGTISILSGNADGTFATSSTVDSVTNPTAILQGDFNGDGSPDLLTLNAAGDLAVLIGNGKGSFASAPALASTGTAGGVTACDFNNDGILDFAIASPASNQILTYLGNGDGTFKIVQSSAGQLTIVDGITAGVGPAYIACGDFNGDGIQDVAYSGQGNSNFPTLSAIALGNGDGTFQAPQIAHFPGRAGPVLAGDFNNDNYSDLAEIDSIDNVVLVESGGVLPARTDYPLPAAHGTIASAIADFNGDGNLDAAFLQLSQDPSDASLVTAAMTVLPGNGDGTFGKAISAPLPNFGEGPMIAGDFNGDGKPDIAMAGVYASLTGFITVVLGNGDGTFGSAVPNPVNLPSLGIQSMAEADFNGDGKADIAVIGNSSLPSSFPLYVLLGNGDGTFQPLLVYNSPDFEDGMAIGDFNHDGRVDIATSAESSNQVRVFLGKGDGTFSAPVVYSSGLSNAIVTNGIFAADFNSDGNPDLVAETTEGLVIFTGNGDGTFNPGVFKPMPVPIIALTTGDFNGDGKPDISWATSGGSGISLSNGFGNFGNVVGFVPTLFPENSAAGDLNGDGALDLVQVSNDAPEGTPMPETATVWTSSPVISISASSLTVASQSSSPQTLQLVNVGNGPLRIKQITATRDFSETSDCPETLAVSQGCTLSISFSPTDGAELGSVTVNDNAYPGLQTIPLIGTAGSPDFIFSSVLPSKTITGGGTATYAASLTDLLAFAGTVSLGCSGAPDGSTCTVSPTAVTLSGADVAKVTIKVSTTARSAAALLQDAKSAGPELAVFSISGFILLALISVRSRKLFSALGAMIAMTVLLLAMSACGGGASTGGLGSGGSPPPPSGTPAGTYTLTVSAISGNLSHTQALSLTVK